MTDRNVGGLDARLDIKAGQPQVAGAGANVDVVPAHPESRVGAQGLTVDYTWPQGVQFGELGLTVEYVRVPVAIPAVRWTVRTFQLTGSAPAVYWDNPAKVFRLARPDLPVVVWNTAATPDRFETLIVGPIGNFRGTTIGALRGRTIATTRGVV